MAKFMDIYEKTNNLIRKLERNKSKTLSQVGIREEISQVADFVLKTDCIQDKKDAQLLWEASQKYRQPKILFLKRLRSVKKFLDSHDLRDELDNHQLKAGRVVIFEISKILQPMIN